MSSKILRPINNKLFEWNSGSYADVDEEAADDGSTVITLSTNGVWKKALFSLTRIDFYGSITSVVIHYRAARTGTYAEDLIKSCIYTHGNYYYGTENTPPQTYTDYSETYNTNPYTGVAWTVQELVDLYAGVYGERLWSGSPNLVVTQIYVEVTYNLLGTVSSTIVRPTANGGVIEMAPSAGSNYQCVDEETANGDTDYVSSNVDYTLETDTYEMQEHSLRNIIYVEVVACIKKGAQPGSCYCAIRTDDTTYYGNLNSAPASYSEISYCWGLNPATDANWQPEDVFQAGVKCGSAYAVGNHPRCTQVYARIYYGINFSAAGPQIIGLRRR